MLHNLIYFIYVQHQRELNNIQSTCFLLAKFSIHKNIYGDYKPLFLILKINNLINKKAVKCINVYKHFHIFRYMFYLIFYIWL